jgi:hypothetical protein
MGIAAQVGQSLLDVAIECCGSLDAVLTIATRNGLSVTEKLTAGRQIEIAQGDVVDRRVVDYYAARGISPATGLSAADETTAPTGGIGYMGIGIDFIVS